jgi:hypothetical protein
VDDARTFWVILVLVVVTGTIAAFILGIEDAWPFILILGGWIVGGTAFIGLGLIEWRRARKRRKL